MRNETYNEGDRVEFTIDGNTDNILTGKITGLVSKHIIDVWIVTPDKPISGWQYSNIAVQSSFIRMEGENRRFGSQN